MIKHRVFKRGNLYYVDFWIDDKRIRRSTKSVKKSDAESMSQLIIKDHIAKHYGKSEFSLLQLIDKYYSFIKLENKKWTDKIPHLESLAKEFGDKNLSEITYMECQEYINKLKGIKRTPATVNRYISTYHHLFNFAIDYEMLEVNPFRKVKKAKEKSRDRFFTDEEISKILGGALELSINANSNNQKLLYYIILTAIYTGMRLSEILNLKWEDYRDHSFIVQESKSGKKRIVPAHPDLIKVLSNLDTFKEYVFDLNRRVPDVITKQWRSLIIKLKIKDARFHDIRHYFSSQLQKNQISMITVSQLMGHSNIKTTQIYSHTDEEQKIKAIKSLRIIK